ncbi:MAG: pyridoxamine 5'-phosphate oxidase family protein [Mycobacterium sp.]|nr:pyridoxamine 5'-phosphate oxidase family protein [Mycobacterium sp.]
MTDQRQFAAVGFHSGELEAQRHAGVQTQAARLARMVGPAELRPGITAILADTTFAAITARDRTGRLWTSPLLGAPGFLHASGPRTLQINTLVPSADPLHSPRTGQPAGVIAIDFTTRRRVRINGTLAASDDAGLTLHVDQAYGNCPQYIQQRRITIGKESDHRARTPQYRAQLLRRTDIRLIESADTFFLGTTHPDSGNDASHRGGPAGFVRATSEGIWWPDYPGNNMFNSFGNLAVDPTAALLFVDFRTGNTLQLSGLAAVDWRALAEGDDGGTGRRVHFITRHVVASGMPDLAAHAPLPEQSDPHRP